MKRLLGFIIGLVAGFGLWQALRALWSDYDGLHWDDDQIAEMQHDGNVHNPDWDADAELEYAGVLVKQRAFSHYMVTRGQLTAFPESPGYAGLVDVASTLGLDTTSMRGARDELYHVFPAHVADAIERMLTGDIWTEDMGWPAGGRSI